MEIIRRFSNIILLPRYLKLQKAKKYKNSEEHRLRIKYATMSELGREYVKTFEQYLSVYRRSMPGFGYSPMYNVHALERFHGLHKNPTESQILAVKIPHYMDWWGQLQLGCQHCCIGRFRYF